MYPDVYGPDEPWPNQSEEEFDKFEEYLRNAFELALKENSSVETRLDIINHHFDGMLMQCARDAGFQDGVIARRDHTFTTITKRSVTVVAPDLKSFQVSWKHLRWWKRGK